MVRASYKEKNIVVAIYPQTILSFCLIVARFNSCYLSERYYLSRLVVYLSLFIRKNTVFCQYNPSPYKFITFATVLLSLIISIICLILLFLWWICFLHQNIIINIIFKSDHLSKRKRIISASSYLIV